MHIVIGSVFSACLHKHECDATVCPVWPTVWLNSRILKCLVICFLQGWQHCTGVMERAMKGAGIDAPILKKSTEVFALEVLTQRKSYSK